MSESETTMTITNPKPMTYRQLRDRLAALSEEQLDSEVKWWGEERGGTVKRVDVLDEEHITTDDREGCSPRSDYADAFDDGSITEDDIEARIPAGSVFLAVD